MEDRKRLVDLEQRVSNIENERIILTRDLTAGLKRFQGELLKMIEALSERLEKVEQAVESGKAPQPGVEQTPSGFRYLPEAERREG